MVSCAKKDITSIVVNYNNSSSINLFEGQYKVQFMNKPDFNKEFIISKDEIKNIKKVYNAQNIENLGDELYIIDEKPLTMPTKDIKYIISFSTGAKQIFIIRTDFRENPLSEIKHKKLKVFIDEIERVIEDKKVIKNTPKSDFISI